MYAQDIFWERSEIEKWIFYEEKIFFVTQTEWRFSLANEDSFIMRKLAGADNEEELIFVIDFVFITRVCSRARPSSAEIRMGTEGSASNRPESA